MPCLHGPCIKAVCSVQFVNEYCISEEKTQEFQTKRLLFLLVNNCIFFIENKNLIKSVIKPNC